MRLLAALLSLASWRLASCATPFIASPLYSKYQRLGVVVGDIADNATLAALIDQKTHRGEVIVFAFNANWLEWAVNMAAQLHHVGFDHFTGLSSGKADCEALRARIPSASCVWTSVPGAAQSEGWASFTQGSMVLWIQRYYACTRFALAGINVLMLDLDSIIFRDPYPELHAPPLADIALIHLKEGFANGGLFYLRKVVPPAEQSPALWTHTHVLWKATLIVDTEHKTKQHLGTFMDQALLNDNLNSAACNGSWLDMPSMYVTGDKAWDNVWWKTFSPAFNKTSGQLSVRPEGERWYCDWERSPAEHSYGEPAGHEQCSGAAAEGGCEVAWSRYKQNQLTNKALEYLYLRLPVDLDPPPPEPRRMEKFAAAPEWVFGHCDSAHSGWRASAIIHLVACSADWGNQGEWTHVGRRALMVAAGAWRREAILEDRATLRFLTVSPELVAAGAPYNSKADAQKLLQQVLAAAVAEGRTPVMPGFRCADLPWLEKADWARHGVFDRRVIKHRGVCYPAPGGRACAHGLAIGGYELLALHGGGADLVTLTAWDQAKTGGDNSALKNQCPEYYN